MIDGSEKRKRQLAFELQNSSVYEKRSNFNLRFSESIQYLALITFSFLLSTCNRNTNFQTINQYFIVYRFVSE